MKHQPSAWLLGLGFCLLALLACKSTPRPNFAQKAFAAADQVKLYQIDGYRTLPAEQKTGEFYLHDFHVIQERKLEEDQVAAIKLALLDASTFDTSAVKSCPMVATMALELLRKGKRTMTVVLSPPPCGKALMFDPKKPRQFSSAELSIGNRLDPLVFGK